MVVGISRVRLMVTALEKRAVVRRIKDKVLARHHVSVAEVGDPERGETAELGFAVVGSDRGVVDSVLDRVMAIVEAEAKVIADDRDVVHFGDGGALGDGGVAHWEPAEPSPPGFGQSAGAGRGAGGRERSAPGRRPMLHVGSHLKRKPR